MLIFRCTTVQESREFAVLGKVSPSFCTRPRVSLGGGLRRRYDPVQNGSEADVGREMPRRVATVAVYGPWGRVSGRQSQAARARPPGFFPCPKGRRLKAVLDKSDFMKLRPFRQTLLCRAEIPLDRVTGAARMDEFLFSENKRARRIRAHQREPVFAEEPVEAIAQALHDTAPLPARFEELIPYAGNAELLREILFALLSSGCVNLHVHDFPCQETVTERPRSSRLARYQAAGGGNVTNACHIPVELDPIARQLVHLLDRTEKRRLGKECRSRWSPYH